MRWIIRLLILLCIVWGIRFVDRAWLSSPGAQAAIEVRVPQAANADQVASILQQAGVIHSAWEYRVYSVLDAAARHAVGGLYEVRTDMSYRTLAHALALDPNHAEVSIQTLEGWTIDDEAARLLAEDQVPTSTTRALIGQSADRAPFDPHLRDTFAFLHDLPASRSLEGYVFPDTYRVWKDDLPMGLVQKQLEHFQQQFGGVQIGPELAPLQNLDDVVKLASIVEAEVPTDQDRKIVAGIFLQRLRDGMRLQSDATLRYVTGSHSAQSSAQELQIDSPYNSYRQNGLPPSPINNPSASSIQAVLHPTLTGYRYFLTDAAGHVYYAKTLAEHEVNRKKAGY